VAQVQMQKLLSRKLKLLRDNVTRQEREDRQSHSELLNEHTKVIIILEMSL
jgi:hypothetical protein